MKIRLLACWLLVSSFSFAQNLTVEKIMQDPKWIGTSPSGIYWGADSKTVYFNWNPEKNISDSAYKYTIGGKDPVKTGYLDGLMQSAISNAMYNVSYTLMAYAYRGDIYLQNIKSGITTRVTKTEEQEMAPRFIMNDEWLVYMRSQNLFAWNLKTGITQQITNISRTDAGTTPIRGGDIQSRGAARNDSVARILTQEQWLLQQQLETSRILKERKDKRNQRNEFLRSNRDTDTLKTIGIGDKSLQNLQVSPDGRFVTYRLFQSPPGTKVAIVPDYVTETGYTTDINTRTKVGSPQGKFEFYVYDRSADKLIPVITDSIPGISDVPDFTKDYPAIFANRKPSPRGVMVAGPYWSESGSNAIVDIRSQDNKDRWIMQA